MGFTLGKKTYIFNEASQVNHTIDGDMLTIPGVLKVDKSQVQIPHYAKDAVTAVQGTLTFTVPTADQLDVTEEGSGISVKIRLDSTRTASDWSNDRIEMSRPIVVGVTVGPSDDGAAIATAISEAYEAYEGEYVTSTLPFTVAVSGADITLTITAGNEHLNFQSLVEFTVENRTVRKVTGTITKSSEAAYTGAQLEEFVRMSLPTTSDLYGIKAGQLPILGALYNYIEFTAKDDWGSGGVDTNYKMHAGLGGTRDEEAGTRYHTFMLFFKQDGGALDTIYGEIGTWLP